MTPQLNARLHKLLTTTDLMAQKGGLILGFTAGRSESSKDMNDVEAFEMCNWLQGQLNQGNEGERMNTMRRKIISLTYEMGWSTPGDWKAAMNKIDNFCTGAHGKFRKPLNDLNYKELVHVTTQFNQMYMKHLKSL